MHAYIRTDIHTSMHRYIRTYAHTYLTVTSPRPPTSNIPPLRPILNVSLQRCSEELLLVKVETRSEDDHRKQHVAEHVVASKSQW